MRQPLRLDRKSTRLNSSHGYISYAVFCLKKKNSVHPDPSVAAPRDHQPVVPICHDSHSLEDGPHRHRAQITLRHPERQPLRLHLLHHHCSRDTAVLYMGYSAITCAATSEWENPRCFVQYQDHSILAERTRLSCD